MQNLAYKASRLVFSHHRARSKVHVYALVRYVLSFDVAWLHKPGSYAMLMDLQPRSLLHR